MPGGGRNAGGVNSPAGFNAGAGGGAGSVSSRPSGPGQRGQRERERAQTQTAGHMQGHGGREECDANAKMLHSSLTSFRALPARRGAAFRSYNAVRRRPARCPPRPARGVGGERDRHAGFHDRSGLGRRELSPLFPDNAGIAVAWTRDADRDGRAPAAGGLPAVRARRASSSQPPASMLRRCSAATSRAGFCCFPISARERIWTRSLQRPRRRSTATPPKR